MKQLLVFNQQEKLVGVLANDSSNKCPYWDDEINETLDGRQTFSFIVPYSHCVSRNYLKIGNYVAYKDDDGNYRMFNIIKLEDTHGSGEDKKKVSCEGHYYELIDCIVIKSSYYGSDIKRAFQSAIAGSRWQVGTVDVNIPYPELVDTTGSTFLTNAFTMTSALANVQKTAEKWQVEVSYRITTDEKAIIGRYIDICKQRGSDNGVRFTFDQNMQSVNRTADFTDLKTRMYGKGKKIAYNTDGTEEFTDFAEAMWSAANGDPVDKPVGQIFVDIPDAIALYGVKTGVHVEETEDINDLLRATYKDLKNISNPKLTYDMNIFDIEKQNGNRAYKVRLGDTVSLLDKTFDLKVKARVIEMTYSLNDPSKTRLTLGNAKNYITDAFGINDPFTDGQSVIPKIVQISIEGGTRNFFFDADGIAQTTATKYTAKVLIDNLEAEPDSYYWLAGGVLIGTADTKTFIPIVDSFNTRDSYVLLQCVVQGITFESKIPIAVSKAGQDGIDGANGINGTDGKDGVDANMLDWVQDWDGQKVSINSKTVVAPRIFIGTNTGTSIAPNLTGVGIGKDVYGGTESKVGIIAYQGNQPTFQVDPNGAVTIGKAGGKQITMDANGNAIIPNISADIITSGTLNASTVSVTNLNASNITTGTMSVSKLKGGTLSLGGSTNSDGLLSIKDASANEIVKADNTGLSITNGKINIKNNAGTSVLSADSSGNMVISGKVTAGTSSRIELDNGYIYFVQNGATVHTISPSRYMPSIYISNYMNMIDATGSIQTDSTGDLTRGQSCYGKIATQWFNLYIPALAGFEYMYFDNLVIDAYSSKDIRIVAGVFANSMAHELHCEVVGWSDRPSGQAYGNGCVYSVNLRVRSDVSVTQSARYVKFCVMIIGALY